MQIGSLVFNPGLWPTLITLVIFGILMSLGFWQLERAAQKQVLLDEYHSAPAAPQLKLDARLESAEGLDYQFASATGHYDSAHQLLLDNRTHAGRAGYQVLTPLKLQGVEVAVLVNRGWVPLGASRQTLPALPVDEGLRTVSGRIKLPSSGGFRLGEEQARQQWPYRIQRVNLHRLAGELDYPLLPLILLLDPQQPDGYVREWNPLLSQFGPERNIGYAVQWFGLAATLMIIYLAVNLRKSGED